MNTSFKLDEHRMMDPKYVIRVVKDKWGNSSTWWERQASRAVKLGHYVAIRGRSDSNLYMLRCWLTAPKYSIDETLDSQNSMLLHIFSRGDTDNSCHDHPWLFETSILCGGYQECLPPKDWDPKSKKGPLHDQNMRWNTPGMTIKHKATDLHCVGVTIPGTCTLVRTGKRVRDWGFFPPGKPYMHWKAFLDEKAAK